MNNPAFEGKPLAPKYSGLNYIYPQRPPFRSTIDLAVPLHREDGQNGGEPAYEELVSWPTKGAFFTHMTTFEEQPEGGRRFYEAMVRFRRSEYLVDVSEETYFRVLLRKSGEDYVGEVLVAGESRRTNVSVFTVFPFE